jgi:hypothetical protein
MAEEKMSTPFKQSNALQLEERKKYHGTGYDECWLKAKLGRKRIYK